MGWEYSHGVGYNEKGRPVTCVVAAAISCLAMIPASQAKRPTSTAKLNARAIFIGAIAQPVAPPKTSPGQVLNPERVIGASTGLKKLDLVRNYEGVAGWILPHLKDRPVSLVRGPTGVGGELFFQKHGDKIGIPGIRELDASLWPDHKPLLEIPSKQALVGAAQLNVIELHTWNSTSAAIGLPDRVIFDLDPGEGVTWQQVQEAAVLTHVMLDQLGLQAWLKTSGGKGLHVVVPLAPEADYDTVNGFSKVVVQHMAKTIPDRFVTVSGGGNRIGKIVIDYLRNGHGATTAAFPARSRPGLGMSMPVYWEQRQELEGGAHWTIVDALTHLDRRADDPWAGYWNARQTLDAVMAALSVKTLCQEKGAAGQLTVWP